MKVQATVLLSFQAKSLAEAGALLDDVLGRARERDDVDVGRLELLSPPGDRTVTLPPVSALSGTHHTSRLRRVRATARSHHRSNVSANAVAVISP
jgi:predicted methyltransferase MtxX (methanogen marker protein 4)